MLNDILNLGGVNTSNFNLGAALLSLLMAVFLGQFTAWVYIYTHSGLSYSKAFVQSIILLTLIVSMVMLVIGNNIIIAFGLIGALAIIRFRNIIKDTRDTAFIFFALVLGMAAGTGRYPLAILGTGVFTAVVLYLHWSAFGARDVGDGFLRFNLSGAKGEMQSIQPILELHCFSTQLISQRFHESGTGEVSYRLIMKDPVKADKMVEELKNISGISNLSFVLREEQAEV